MPSLLCYRCSRIPFDPDLRTLRSPDYAGPIVWPMGTFGQVRASNCPFCELLTTICVKPRFSWEPFVPPEDSEEVFVGLTKAGFKVGHMVVRDDLVVENRVVGNIESWVCIAAFDEFIDLDNVRRWVSTCDQKHGTECSSTWPFNPAILPRTGKRQLDFRVIDVDTMCIVYAPPGCKYIALSYVWGARDRSRLVLTSHNEETLMQPGALANARVSVPNTILDAITVVRKLRERYLWVDSLCLAQDDADELQECVSIMDLFYEMAMLTIIAGDGEDAWAGLPGVAPTPRRLNRPVREITPGLTMTTMVDMETLLRKATYSTRGWTMQEEIIPRRHLVFIDGQVYYRCAEAYYSEVLNPPGKPLHNQHSATGSTYYMILKESQATFQEFAAMMMYYTLRKLSFQSDILRAAQGMLRKFSVLTGLHCFEGLPAPLDRSLLFHKSTRRSREFGRREGFPSYSWTGWKSVLLYDEHLASRVAISNDRSVDDNHPAASTSDLRVWIIWHCRLEDGNLCRISDTGRLRKSLLLAPEDSQRRVRRRFREIPVSVSDVDFGTVRASSYPLLLFWTICLNLRLKRMPQERECPVGLVNCQAMDRYGESCGVVEMDTTVPDITQGRFALLAAREDSFWALMLKWEDGVAERRGVAKLSKDVLDSCLPPGLRWKAVILG